MNEMLSVNPKALAAVGEGLVELRAGRGQDKLEIGFGGDAANVCVMAARAGTPARLGGRVGTDALGERLVAFWRAAGVDTHWLLGDPEASTGLYLNEPAPGGGHRFAYWRTGSAGSRLAPGDVPAASFLAGAGMLLVTGVTVSISASAAAAADELAARARAAGLPVAFVVNHRPALAPDADLLHRWARECDILLLSDEDAAALPGIEDGARSASEVVRTAGGAPAVLRWAGEEHRCAPAPVAVVDAAGAGDALAGTYLASRLAGMAPPDALRRGVAAASLSVGRQGCAASYPSGPEIDAALGRAVKA
jgi:2-dehydro-3-deoxygluconokinase